MSNTTTILNSQIQEMLKEIRGILQTVQRPPDQVILGASINQWIRPLGSILACTCKSIRLIIKIYTDLVVHYQICMNI